MRIIVSFVIVSFIGINAALAQRDSLPKGAGQGDYSPDVNNQIQIENLIEQSGSDDGSGFQFDTQFENLETYRVQPLDLNKVKEDELVSLGLLSAVQIQAFMEYRARVKFIASVYELRQIAAWDRETVQSILPFVMLSSAKETATPSLLKMLSRSQRVVFMRWQRVLEAQKGYGGDAGTNYYLGSPDKLFSRVRLTYKQNLSMGVTMEKDAGEEWFRGSNKKGFDFYSAHFFMNGVNKYVKQVALGDYSVAWGQGLLMWTAFGGRKGASPLNVRRQAPALKAYTSAGEALFLRGAAVTLTPHKRVETTVFASMRFRDANLAQLQDSLLQEQDNQGISSLLETGYHRTNAELADRNAVRESTLGARVKYRSDFFHVSLNTMYSNLSKPLNRNPQLYNQFYFNGTGLFSGSLDYAAFYRGYQFWGETAVSANGGIASLNGASAVLDEKLELLMLHRYYARNYQSLWANAFAEGTTNNEEGFYVGAATNISAKLHASAYLDVYRFPWLRYGVDGPTRGHDVFLRLDYPLSRRTNLYAIIRDEVKQDNQTNNTTRLDILVPIRRSSIRMHADCVLSPEWTLRSRVEFVRFDNSTSISPGFMAYQDIVWRPMAGRLQAQLRFAVFDTKDYNSRIYTFENDVLYAFSAPSYYSKGFRTYLNLNYDFNQAVSIWARIGHTVWADRETVGSGLDEIDGQSRTEAKLQLRVKF